LDEGFGASFEAPPLEGEDCCDPCFGVVTDTVILIFFRKPRVAEYRARLRSLE